MTEYTPSCELNHTADYRRYDRVRGEGAFLLFSVNSHNSRVFGLPLFLFTLTHLGISSSQYPSSLADTSPRARSPVSFPFTFPHYSLSPSQNSSSLGNICRAHTRLPHFFISLSPSPHAHRVSQILFSNEIVFASHSLPATR